MTIGADRKVLIPDPARVRSTLAAVSGVTDVHVDVDDVARRTSVRLVLDPGVDETVVALAVHRALHLEFGPGLGHVRLEVLDDGSTDGRRPPQHLRPSGSGSRARRSPARALLSGRPDVSDVEVDPGVGPGPAAEIVLDDDPLTASAAVEPNADAETTPEAPAPAPTPTDAGSPPAGPGSSAVTVVADATGVIASVTLTRDGVELVGTSQLEASAVAATRSVSFATARALTAVAAATLRALDGVVGEGVRLHVDSVSLTPVGVARVAIAQVFWVSPQGSQRLTGSAEVDDDARSAMVRATVDAVNRRLDPPFLLT